jgi:hypothetical protein
MIIEQQVPASSSPKNVDPRPRTYDNFKNYYFELFDRLIPVEFKKSSIKNIKNNSLSAQAYERLMRHLKHWLSTDPTAKVDPADTKSKESLELLFSNWMDKTLSARRQQLKRDEQKIDNEFDSTEEDPNYVDSLDEEL